MRAKAALSLFAIVLLASLACGPLGNLTGGSGAGTAAALWPDVPAFPGADKVDLDMPLVVRLAVEAASKAIMTQGGEDVGDLTFIAFTTTQSPEEVTTFYTPDRMAAEGWTGGETPGCGITGAADQQGGAMCVFVKEGEDLNSGLFIVISPEDGKTSLFYVRIDAKPEALATQFSY